MGILTKNTETLRARLADYFLARLVRAAQDSAIEQAVEGGLLAEVEESGKAGKGRKAKAAEPRMTIADLDVE